jgi:phage shock protein A
MANNAIFARLANLWTGFISLWVSDVEKEHPEIAYQNAIASMIEKYAQLKAATGAIIARRQDITARLEAHERELAGVAADLETALATNQDDLAVVLIQKKNTLDAAITELRADATRPRRTPTAPKTRSRKSRPKSTNSRPRKTACCANAQCAGAPENPEPARRPERGCRSAGAGRRARPHQEPGGTSQPGRELRESDLDVRLNKLRQSSASVTAKAQLDALKAARAGAQAAPAKTL